MTKRHCLTTALLAACILFGPVARGLAQEPAGEPGVTPAAAAPTPVPDWKYAADTMWVMVTGFLVFFMNLGFGCVEAGFARAKNYVNILSKNFFVFAVSTLGFWLLGLLLMFGVGNEWNNQKGLWMVSGSGGA